MKHFILLSTVFLILGFTSCKKSNTTSGYSNVSVKLTDGPGPYNAVILSIKSVIITTSGGEETLNIGGGPIDILHFRLGKDTLLAAKDIPAGEIQQIRLVLNTTGNRVVVNGTSYDMTTPSGQTSGVKLNLHDILTSGVGYSLKLDFDAAQSIVTTGNGKYSLKPVIRVISQAVTGALAGTVTPISSFPKVYAIMGTDTIGTMTDSTGKFYFPGLAAGTYSVKFTPVSPLAVKTVTNVTVTNGSVKDMGSVTLTQ
jgi:hypothetical protein